MIELHEQQHICIKRPVGFVFAHISKLENLLTWSNMLASVKLIAPQPQKTGSLMNFIIYFAGKRMEFTFKLIEYEPDCSLTLKSIAGIAPCYIHFQLETTADGGTDLMREIIVQIMEEELGPNAAALRRIFHTQMQFNLFSLKDVLEAHVETSDEPEP